MARSKAYLFGGVEIRWSCDKSLITDDTPEKATFHFPGGLKEYLEATINGQTRVTKDLFAGRTQKEGGHGSVEWAVCWVADEDGFLNSYCNTIPTAEGGTHENGLRGALSKGLRDFGERVGNRKAAPDHRRGRARHGGGACSRCSSASRSSRARPRTSSPPRKRPASSRTRCAMPSTTGSQTARRSATKLLEWSIDQAEDRLKRKREKEIGRQSATRKLRLPGKLADCSNSSKQGTEIFIVEGDSAGGSAKQARNRENQAILPLRGKILNVANASSQKLSQNQLLSDLVAGARRRHRHQVSRRGSALRARDHHDGRRRRRRPHRLAAHHLLLPGDAGADRERASLPGHAAALQAHPRRQVGLRARRRATRTRLLKSEFAANAKVEVSRFKGLGEMNAPQLKETTMDLTKRTLLRVSINGDRAKVTDTVNALMGSKPEARFRFIQERAAFAKDLDI